MKASLLPVLAWFLVSVEVASAVTINHIPFVIKKPGKYIVTSNLMVSDSAAIPVGYSIGSTGPAGAGITIDASDVDLDLGGFSVLSNDGNPLFVWGVFVFSGSRIRIHNGRIHDFKSAFNHDYSARSLVFEDLAVDAANEGIDLAADGSSVRHCTFRLTGPGGGTGLSVGSTGTLTAIFIEGCSFSGLSLSGQNGLGVGGGSAWVTVRGCSFTNLSTGLSGASKASIADCLFTNCTTKYTSVNNAAGFNQ